MTEEQVVIRAALRLADAVLDTLEVRETWHTTNKARTNRAARRRRTGKGRIRFAAKGKEALVERTTKDYAGADYYYDTATFKRWITDADPCDLCEENEAAGWIDIDDVWPNADDVPCHPNCLCTTEEKERRYRVYV